MKKTTFVAALMLALAGGNAGAYDFDKPLYGPPITASTHPPTASTRTSGSCARPASQW